MILAIPIEEVRDQFASLPERFSRDPDLTVQVTRDGMPVMAVFSWEMYESIIETMEIMADPDLMAALRQSANDIAQGKMKDWEVVKAELGF